MAAYQVLYWKEIPAQIRVYDGKKPKAFQMPDWFQQEIDRVAMDEGLVGTDEYLDAWAWSEKMERDGGVEDVAEVLLAELERVYRTK